MQAHTYGYARVSSHDQNEDRQLIAMREAGVPEENVYLDKQSGKDFNRPAYRQLVKDLNAGDLLYVLSIDRLGRKFWALYQKSIFSFPLLQNGGLTLIRNRIIMPSVNTISYQEGEVAMDPNLALLHRLTLAENRIDGVYYYFARRLGLNENMLALLYALDDDEPHSQKEICDEWVIPRTTVNSVVKSMAADGYLTLESAPRSKEKLLRLTPRGREYASDLLGELYSAEYESITKAVAKYGTSFVDGLEYFCSCLQQAYENTRTAKPVAETKNTGDSAE